MKRSLKNQHRQSCGGQGYGRIRPTGWLSQQTDQRGSRLRLCFAASRGPLSREGTLPPFLCCIKQLAVFQCWDDMNPHRKGGLRCTKNNLAICHRVRIFVREAERHSREWLKWLKPRPEKCRHSPCRNLNPSLRLISLYVSCGGFAYSRRL